MKKPVKVEIGHSELKVKGKRIAHGSEKLNNTETVVTSEGVTFQMRFGNFKDNMVNHGATGEYDHDDYPHSTEMYSVSKK